MKSKTTKITMAIALWGCLLNSMIELFFAFLPLNVLEEGLQFFNRDIVMSVRVTDYVSLAITFVELGLVLWAAIAVFGRTSRKSAGIFCTISVIFVGILYVIKVFEAIEFRRGLGDISAESRVAYSVIANIKDITTYIPDFLTYLFLPITCGTLISKESLPEAVEKRTKTLAISVAVVSIIRLVWHLLVFFVIQPIATVSGYRPMTQAGFVVNGLSTVLCTVLAVAFLFAYARTKKISERKKGRNLWCGMIVGCVLVYVLFNALNRVATNYVFTMQDVPYIVKYSGLSSLDSLPGSIILLAVFILIGITFGTLCRGEEKDPDPIPNQVN